MFDNILSINKKFNKKNKDIRVEVPVPDFIPYACHWNHNSILTKNGELLQVIKITGFSNEAVGSENLDLRKLIRLAVKENIKSDDFALWIHTIRRKKNIDPGGDFNNAFCQDLNKHWKERHNWKETYINEVYITIIIDGTDAKIKDLSSILNSLSFFRLQKHHEKCLEKMHSKLSMAVDGMLGVLAPFGAKRLGVVKRGASYYSATLEFFAKILNLGEVSVRMQVRDVSECIAAYGIAIGFNNMEVRGRLGKKFGAMFSLKEYYEVTGKYLDKILLLPQEFIITQTIDFINSDAALRNYKYQDYILSLGKDDELSEATGLKEIVNNQNAGPTAFGDSQITFFLIDSDVNQLEKNVVEFATTLSGIGYVAPRRDVRLEECFWAQLPGNFNYISRKKPISTGYVGGFASLYNYPAGRIAGNLWGSAVTMMHTVAGTPLFFSFHVGDNGHTAILGPDGMGKTVLMNFFVSEAQKFGGRLFFFDQDLVSSVFIKAMGGKYIVIDSIKASKNCAYNPFTLADTQENRIFLKEWLVTLAEYGNFTANNAEKAHIEKLVDYIYTIPYEYRKLSYIAKSFGEIKEGSLGQRMSVWHSEGKYAHLFDNDIDSMNPLDSMIYGFCMSSLVKDGNSLCPVLAYLFHLIEISLDGLPTIIVLDKAWSLVNNKVFAPKMKAWLERLRKKNALVIFATETVQNDKINSMNKEITESIATKLFLPNYDADDSSVAYKQVWGLSSEEFNTLSRMRPDKRQFMFKQGNKSVVTTLDLAGFEEVNILSGGDKTVKLMEEAINEVGSDHLQWLPRLYEKLKSAK